MRWLLSFLMVVGMATVLPLSAPGTADACSCAYEQNGPRIIEQVSHSTVAFTGTTIAKRSDGDTVYYEFSVREVFSGDVGAATVVSSSTQSAACGRNFTLGTEYFLFVSDRETKNAPWSVESCSATTESSNTQTRDAAIVVYGQAQPPDQHIRSVGIDDIRGPLWQKLAAAAAVAIAAAMLVRRWSGRHKGPN